MARRPAFQFYPSDWRNNKNLRRCGWAARGAWIEVMSLMHDSDEYGLLRWSIKEVAQGIGCPISLIRELIDKGVMKGCDSGLCEEYIFVPRSGRKDGDPVMLVASQGGPIWYSSRMVKDEYLRGIRGGETRFDPSPDKASKPSPKGGLGERKSDGSSTSSSSSSSNNPVVVVIADIWWPSEKICNDLEMLQGYSREWIDQQVPSFIEYWQKRAEEPRTTWDALFFDHCVNRAKLRSVS